MRTSRSRTATHLWKRASDSRQNENLQVPADEGPAEETMAGLSCLEDLRSERVCAARQEARPLCSKWRMTLSSMPTSHHEGRFTGSGGTELFFQSWLPALAPAAVLVNLHGLGDHSGLYPSLAEFFPLRGIALYAFDPRGNGRSPGQRAYIRSWDQYRDDLQRFLDRVRNWHPNLPLFVLGNSLGGLIVLE